MMRHFPCVLFLRFFKSLFLAYFIDNQMNQMNQLRETGHVGIVVLLGCCTLSFWVKHQSREYLSRNGSHL